MGNHVVVIDLVGAVPKHFDQPSLFPELASIFRPGGIRPVRPVFPAVTCPVQVSMVTGVPPSQHGIIANGLFDRERHEVTMWTWPASRIERPAVWDVLRKRAPRARTAVFFFQGLKAATTDIYLNPHPKHTPDGGIIPWCDSRPEGLYERLVEKLGHFPLHKYWGPMADIDSSRWILNGALHAIAEYRPELSLVYVPHLDYVGQRCGPDSLEFAAEARRIDGLVAQFIRDLGMALKPADPVVLLTSEYAFRPVSRAALPNVALRDAGLLKVVEKDGCELPDMAASAAFAMADHQVAHVYVQGDALGAVRGVLTELDGAGEVCGTERLRELGAAHPNSGDLVVLARPDTWFAYYWWNDPEKAPPFARTVDIHRKPGYDPVELFVDAKTRSIPLDTSLVRGSHGLPPVSPADRVILAVAGADMTAPAVSDVAGVAGLAAELVLSGRA